LKSLIQRAVDERLRKRLLRLFTNFELSRLSFSLESVPSLFYLSRALAVSARTSTSGGLELSFLSQFFGRFRSRSLYGSTPCCVPGKGTSLLFSVFCVCALPSSLRCPPPLKLPTSLTYLKGRGLLIPSREKIWFLWFLRLSVGFAKVFIKDLGYQCGAAEGRAKRGPRPPRLGSLPGSFYSPSSFTNGFRKHRRRKALARLLLQTFLDLNCTFPQFSFCSTLLEVRGFTAPKGIRNHLCL